MVLADMRCSFLSHTAAKRAHRVSENGCAQTVGMVHNDAPCGPFHFRQLHRVFDLCVEAYYRQSKMRTARASTFSRSWQKRETA